MVLDDDTIVAQATAPGRGALAVVRVSGRDAHQIGRMVVTPWPREARRASLAAVRDRTTGAVVDQVVAVVYDAPRSYTGEPMLEVTSHGGLVAPAAVLAAFVEAGARVARPGEFTQRAVLQGKLDLVQAEGIADVVDARTDAFRRTALVQIEGGFTRAIAELRTAFLHLEALLAYDIDFPEEDDGPIARVRVVEAADGLDARLTALLGTADLGEIARSGAVVVVAGPPNAGKSSLFNSLIGQERAIVTDVPGTTRDALEATLDDSRVPLRLVDTAGLRESRDVVERLGIEVSVRHLAGAHVVLACGATSSELEEAFERVATHTRGAVLRVQTKLDVSRRRLAEADVAVSALDRTGLDELVGLVRRMVEERYGAVEPDVPVVTRTRHRVALERARAELRDFRRVFAEGQLPAVVSAVHVREAVRALDGLIGTVDVEDVLGAVFAEFCVGK
jgi:tRNA modification GTPase